MFKQAPFLTALAVLFASCFYACSNSVSVDEFGVPLSYYTFDDASQDSAFIKDTFTIFPPSGFYPKPFTILFPNNEPLNCKVGGATPTKENPAKNKLRIDSTSTIRCINLSTNHSKEIIRTYIFEKKPTIPAIFITTDPNSLFNPDTGIYMEGPNAEKTGSHRGANYWQDKEIPIFIELTEADAFIPAFSKYAGLKIFGHYSRMLAKKSVAITFREKYGEKRLYYNLFPDFPQLTQFKSFVLRDFSYNFGKDYIRDRLSSSISEGMNVDYQRGRYVIVYYNGEYYGIHDMRERSNEYYFETHYGIKHKNINLLKADNSVSAGSSEDFISLMNWLKDHDLDNKEHYDYIASKIDIDNYINYLLVQIFANNQDWPGNNLKKWNSTNPTTLWKWFLYDLDYGFNYNVIDDNIFVFLSSEGKTNYANAPEHTLLFRKLLQNQEFKESLINRMVTLFQTNFESSKILIQIDKMMEEIEGEIPRDQKRWSHSTSKMNQELRSIKKFAADRSTYLTKHVQEYFKLGESVPVTLSVEGSGKILVHNLPLDKYPLTIQFFKGFPVTVTAEPQNGATWSQWSDGNKIPQRVIYFDKSANLTAIFK